PEVRLQVTGCQAKAPGDLRALPLSFLDRAVEETQVGGRDAREGRLRGDDDRRGRRLAEAEQRDVEARPVPERAGSPVRIEVHVVVRPKADRPPAGLVEVEAELLVQPDGLVIGLAVDDAAELDREEP